MASFPNKTITAAGEALNARLLAGERIPFVLFRTSSKQYATEELHGLNDLEEVMQETGITRTTVVNDTCVRAEGGVDNAGLAQGYECWTVGIYARDAEDTLILFAVFTTDRADWMPASSGVATSGILFDFTVAVSNSENVELILNPTASATLLDIQRLEGELAALRDDAREDLEAAVEAHDADETAHPAILHIIEELAGEGIGAHNTDDSAHPDIRTEMARKANQADVYDKATVDSKIANATPPTATGSSKGIVQLSDAVNSTSNANGGIAATPAAVKSAYDLAGTANNTANSANTTANNANTNANGRAPTSHAVNAGTYGLGTAGVFGHVKLSDTFNSNPGAAAAGIGASGQAVYNAWVVANTANNTANAAKQSTAYATSAGSAVVSTKLSDTQGGFTVGVGYGIVQLGTGLSPGLVLSSYASQILINNGSIIPVSNGTADLGMSANRFRGIYLASNPSVSSDKRLKTNIQKVDSHTALGIMEALDGSAFDKRNTLESDEFNTKAFGFIAQDVQEAFAANGIDLTEENHTLLSIPESPESDTYGIQYEQLIPILWQAVKGLSHRVEQLEQALALQGKGNTTKQRKRGNANA